jgi:hypothetical protein
MRFGDVDDLFGSACFDEFSDDFATVEFRIFDLAVELAIREGASPTFTELYVGLRIEYVFAPELPGVFECVPERLCRAPTLGA